MHQVKPSRETEPLLAPLCVNGGHKLLADRFLLEAVASYLQGRPVFHVPVMRIHCASCEALNTIDSRRPSKPIEARASPRIELRLARAWRRTSAAEARPLTTA